jgi:HAD superfamily hydrolase (TIGR01509 family)
MNNNSTFAVDPTFRAVLFDLSGTTLDEGYIRHGFAAVAAEMASRWKIDPGAAAAAFMPVFRAVSTRYASRPVYLMSDVVSDMYAQIITEFGGSAHDDELLTLEACMWQAAIPRATATEGAIETLTLLRDSGIKTGIVSYADASVFRSLLEQTGLAGLTDVELCSEEAGSCKPDAAIFLQALAAVDTSPQDALFVGDTVETDIVGASRVGMRTALLSGREFSLDLGSDAAADHRPTYRISKLSEVVDLVLTHRAGTAEIDHVFHAAALAKRIRLLTR